MFNVGGPEILIIFIVALVVLGPQQLPKAMRTFGAVMTEVRKVSNSFQAEVRNVMDTVVDTTAEEKPQSAKMATVDSDATEVVARNVPTDDAPAADAQPPAGSAPGTASGTDDRPTIDPADRAAG
jgi:sec-independent protein translocase protein TatB